MSVFQISYSNLIYNANLTIIARISIISLHFISGKIYIGKNRLNDIRVQSPFFRDSYANGSRIAIQVLICRQNNISLQ